MGNIDIGEAIGYGWAKVKGNMGFHILAMLIVLVVSSVTFGIAAGPMLVGYFRTMKKDENGGAPDIADLFGAFDAFIPSIVVMIALVLVSMVPFAGLLMTPIALIAFSVIADGERDGVAALKRAWAIANTNMAGAIVGILVAHIVGGLGLLACCVGIFVSAPVAYAACYRIVSLLRAGAPSL